ncbi:MAG: class I adenylate-forming enzyme family protein [Gammaproteobacteria bacterium]|nr:class I adenylate-forming enzyme family protein [Gammaproteobacteria bacterium]
MSNVTRAQAIATLTAPGQTYELESLVINDANLRVFKNAPRSLRELYVETASDATFFVYAEERLSFAEVYRGASQIATVLVNEYGVRKGDRVAISMRNYPEWILTFAAATSIGAIAVSMNALWQSEELEYGLADCGAKVLFADQERLDRLAGCSVSPDLGVVAVRPTQANDGVAVLDELVENLASNGGAVQMPEVDIAPDDDATIFFTSGSTGHPKGVVSTHRNLVTALMSWELDGQCAALVQGVAVPDPVHQPAALLAVPLFHATGSHAIYLMSYRTQRKIVSMYKWDPDLAAELIEREHITSFIAPPAMTGDLVQVARRTRHDLTSLLTVGGGGAPRAPGQVKDIGESFDTALPNTGWGMTETNAIGTGIGGTAYLDRPASSGQCSAVLDLKVVSEDGQTLLAGQRGELMIRGTSMFRGYWNRPQANADSFVDGWFRTGDVAYLDDEGFLFIVDRIKDLIIRGGENIGCGEVEAALLIHPEVLEAAVYAVPDERLGEEVGATICAGRGLQEDELREFLVEHVARFKIPRYIKMSSDPLPRIASGKIFKRQLREQAIAALGIG